MASRELLDKVADSVPAHLLSQGVPSFQHVEFGEYIQVAETALQSSHDTPQAC